MLTECGQPESNKRNRYHYSEPHIFTCYSNHTEHLHLLNDISTFSSSLPRPRSSTPISCISVTCAVAVAISVHRAVTYTNSPGFYLTGKYGFYRSYSGGWLTENCRENGQCPLALGVIIRLFSDGVVSVRIYLTNNDCCLFRCLC